MFFSLERSIYSKGAPDPVSGNHVFVSGLARAGTTVLMRAIYNSNQFASLTYKDMPFALCPNLWKTVTDLFSRQPHSQERAHGDGVAVDFNSPEAFDEVFWLVFSKQDYIQENGLIPHLPNKETQEYFVDYVGLILRSRHKTRYLSKNNNNILRLSALKAIFPKAIFLIPVRDPATHCQSLLAQHQRFTKGDVFTKKYMTWLGHHEFGDTHKPFILSAEEKQCTDTASLDYWVELWLHCYEYLSQRFLFTEESNIYFVPYESLCNDQNVWRRLAELTGIDLGVKNEFRQSKASANIESDCSLMQRAKELYSEVKIQSLKKLRI